MHVLAGSISRVFRTINFFHIAHEEAMVEFDRALINEVTIIILVLLALCLVSEDESSSVYVES